MERAHYIAYVRATLCKEVKDDNVVYHGLGGNLLIGVLPHLIRVRVIADMEFRIKAAMERNQMTRKEAIDHIKKVDEKRVKWTKFLYHVDWGDPSLYDLVINLENLGISDACEIVSKATTFDRFKTTPEAQKLMNDLELSTEVRARYHPWRNCRIITGCG
jgi:cytidylate kinase